MRLRRGRMASAWFCAGWFCRRRSTKGKGRDQMLWLFVQSLINGVLSGGVYALVAVGITVIFGVMKMINFASGEYVMIGCYFTYLFYELTGWQNYFLIPFVAVAMAVFSWICFNLVIRPVLGRGGTSFILVTVGLSFFLMNLIEFIFGPTQREVVSGLKTSSIRLGLFTIGWPRLLALIIAVLLVIVVNILLNKTLLGRAMRATSEKSDVAQMLGINVKRTYTIAFMIGVILAGVAGCIITPLYYVYPQVGNLYKTTALMAVVLGGMGNVKGAFVGGILVGLAESLVASLVAPDLGPMGIFVLFLIVLYIKPQGLFAKRERVG